MNEIRIACEPGPLLDIDEMDEFQGDLKDLSEEDYLKLRTEIVETGFAFMPYVWADPSDGRWKILDAHQRKRVMKKMREEGWQIPKIPTVQVHAKDRNEAKRRILQATSQYGKMTEDGLHKFMFEDAKIGIDDLENSFRLPDIDLDHFKANFFEDPAAGGAGEDDIPPLPIVPKSNIGDLWLLGDHRILCGDCTVKENVERLMNGEKADMVFTSPPYSDLRDYKGGLDLSIQKLGNIFDWPTDLFCINLGLIIRERTIFQYWNEWLEEAKKRNLPLLSWNVWDKGHASAPAHQQAMFGLSHEWIFVFGKYRELERIIENKCAGETHAGNATVREKDGSLSSKSRTKIQKYRQLDSVLRLPAINCRSSEYSGHPASFPIAFSELHIKSVQQGALIAEPFLGSGSTLIACEKTGRKGYGMEIDPIYIDVILSRWAKFSGKDPVREDGVKWSELKGEEK
jgi:DNA modification methylase